MAIISKEMFDEKLSILNCDVLIHPWDSNCVSGISTFVYGCTKGICSFMAIMYTAQYILRRKKLTKEDSKRILKDYFKSVLFGLLYALSFISYNCTLRHLMSKLNFYLTIFGTGIAMGLSSFVSPNSRVSLEAQYFSVMALECFLRKLAFSRLLPRNKMAAAPLFMVCNSFMMLLLWKKQNTYKSLDIQWIFKPYKNKGNSENKLCCHNGACVKDIIKVCTKYFLVGGGIGTIKLLIDLFKKRETNPLKILSLTHLKEALFLSSYVGLHKAVHCFLTEWRGKDCYEHAAIAGFLSGIAYIIRPNLSVAASAIVLIIKTVFNELKKKYRIPKLPYQNFAFIISNSILMYYSFVHRRLVPNFFTGMLTLGTNGRSNLIFNNIDKLSGIKQ